MENTSKISDEISLSELIGTVKDWSKYLFQQWKIITITVILGAALGVFYSSVKKPTYTAALSFVIEDEKSGGGLGSALGLVGSLGLDLGGSGGGIFTGANLTELFKSRSMVEKTLLSPVNYNNKVISLAEMYIEINQWRELWKEDKKLKDIKFLPNDNRIGFTRVQDSVLGSIYLNLSKGGLNVGQKDKKISVITIDVASKSELFAKYFCESLAKEVSNFYVQTKSKKARMNMDILQRQTDSIRRELNSAITGVASANDNTFNLNPALNIRRTPSARRQVDVQANTAILTELVKQCELAKVTLRKETPLIQVIDRPILPLQKDRFGKTKGLIFGGFLGGFFIIMILILRRIF